MGVWVAWPRIAVIRVNKPYVPSVLNFYKPPRKQLES